MGKAIYRGVCNRTYYLVLYFWSCVERLWNFILCQKSRRRTTAQTELLLLILFIPRPEWSVQLSSALCIGTDYETTAGGMKLVGCLKLTECEGNRFRGDNLLF